MTETESLQETRFFDAKRFLELGEKALSSRDLEDFASYVVRWTASAFRSSATFVCVAPRLPAAFCFHHFGLSRLEAFEVSEACAASVGHPGETGGREGTAAKRLPRIAGDWLLQPLDFEQETRGFLGLRPTPPDSGAGSGVPGIARFIEQAVESILGRMKTARQISYFNTYLTVSSLLAKPMGLHELMESILYFCTEVASSEEASVLLLDAERDHFRFFQTEGPSRPLLTGQTFPASEGIAGSALRSRKSEIIHDVQNDPRFCKRFDSTSGVRTRNMIVIPLVAEDEPVGVLEVINKVGGLPFTEEDRLLLHFIADEIAFAVRNARIFELVVDSYCKQRQGQQTCEGCRRPLGSWTPCVKYREAVGL